MIKLNGISVALGGNQILQDVDLEASAGQFTAILGPNGSGKTTLLKTITGELGYEGHITINERDLSQLSAFDQSRLRGVLPQSSQVAFPFTVREIVTLGGQPRPTSHHDHRAVGDVLLRVDLAGFASRRYNELSGGEQQRAQLARVLYQIGFPHSELTPKWLLLDEPVSSLDIRHQIQIMNVARDFCRQGGGVIAVMHDLNLSAMYADQIVMLKCGRLAASGSPKAVLHSDRVSAVFDCAMRLNETPNQDVPFVLPHSIGLSSNFTPRPNLGPTNS